MGKTISIFLLSVYILSANSFLELLKAGTLLEHYRETKSKSNGISFLDFMVMHYVTDDGNIADNDRDSQLPFKSQRNVSANIFNVFILKKSEEVKWPIPVPAEKQFSDYSGQSEYIAYHGDIWRPPQILQFSLRS